MTVPRDMRIAYLEQMAHLEEGRCGCGVPAPRWGAGSPPVRCRFYARADAPLFTEHCEQNATEPVDHGETTRIRQWIAEHPKAWIGVEPGPLYLCDTHLDTWREML